jgi:hypothetical protein
MKAYLLLLTLIFSLQGCKKYERANPYDKKVEERKFALAFSHKIVKESILTDGKLQDNETVYYTITLKNTGPDVAYLTSCYVTQGGPDGDYQAHPREDGAIIEFRGGNPFDLNGFCDVNAEITPLYNKIGSIDYTAKIYAFSSSQPGRTITLTFHAFDQNNKEYTYDFTITTI